MLRRTDAIREVSALLDRVDEFFTRVGSRAGFTKGREFRVRTPYFVEDSLTAPLAKLHGQLVQTIREITDESVKA